MNILIDSLLCVILLGLGYYGVCSYLSEQKLVKPDAKLLKISRNRIIYLVAGFVTSVVLILVLDFYYNRDLTQQLKLLSIMLIILPNAAVDFRVHKMPNVFMIAGLIIRVLLFAVEFFLKRDTFLNSVIDSLLGGLIIGVFFFLLLIIFKNSIGMGDVKLFALMGLFQGLWGAVNSIFFSLIITFFLSIYLLIAKKKKKKDTISFGPEIYLGTLIGICLAGM